MLRRCGFRAQQLADDGSRNVMGRVEGFHRTTKLKRDTETIKKYRATRRVSGEEIVSRGIAVKKSAESLQKALQAMENPMVWVWYPWRRNPEPPLPSFPCPNALKTLNGALITDLSPTQKQRREEMLTAAAATDNTKAARQHATKHPFLAQILRETGGGGGRQRVGFPFFFKKYPTTRHALDARFGIPTEMIENLPSELQRTLSTQQMSIPERQKRQENIYVERYAEHDLDTKSPAVRAVKHAIRIREGREHLMDNPNNNIKKFIVGISERKLRNALRTLRRRNFRQYWEILRDHDMMEVMQPTNAVNYRWGAYWRFDWEMGNAICTNIGDFMDPRGLNGCIETGRSRAEVARDLGLSYTRPLNDAEKKKITGNMLYWSELQKFKLENPDAFKRRQRLEFISKFTSLHNRTSQKTAVADFPSVYRRLLGVKVLRWRSKRHGPE